MTVLTQMQEHEHKHKSNHILLFKSLANLGRDFTLEINEHNHSLSRIKIFILEELTEHIFALSKSLVNQIYIDHQHATSKITKKFRKFQIMKWYESQK